MSALDQAAGDTGPLMRAIWRALTNNERRVARALAVLTTPLYGEETAAAVGIKRSRIGKALESLIANADVIHQDNKPRLTDPMFELGCAPADSLPLRAMTTRSSSRRSGSEQDQLYRSARDDERHATMTGQAAT